MDLGGPSWCLLVGLCTLLCPPTTQGGPEGDVTPTPRLEESGYHFPRDQDPLHQDPLHQDPPHQDPPHQDPQRCGITFHTPNPCSPHGTPPTSSSSSSSSRDELDDLRRLLRDTKATLKDLEEAAMLEDNQTRYQDVITQALPAIHGANLEFGESLDHVRRELEAHVAQAHHPRAEERKEELQRGVRVVAHMLRLTSRLAQALDAASQRLHAQLSQRLQSSATPPP